MNRILLDYFRNKLRFDLIAGLTVAMIVIPQAMAYAPIAGVNPIYGLYTAIIPAIFGAIFGSSNFLVTGPTNPTALVTASVLLLFAGSEHYTEMVFLLAILAGVIKLALGVLRLGTIIRFVSNSVLTGFLTAAGVLIITGQIGHMVGISAGGANAFQILQRLASGIAGFNYQSALTGLLAAAIIISGARISRVAPWSLVAIIASGAWVQLAGWQAHGVRLVVDLGIPDKPLAGFFMPALAAVDALPLVSAAGAVALFGLVEAMSIAKALSLSSGQRIDPSRELVGQGLASIAGGFFQCIPSSGSPSRSALNYNAGAKTRLAAAFSGLFVLLVLAVFARWTAFIPLPALAAVVILAARGLIDRRHIQLTWQSRAASRIVLVTTFAATLLLPLHYAIYLGGLLSILIYLYESGHLELSYLTVNEEGSFLERRLEDLYQDPPEIAMINIEGDLYFGAVSDLEAAMDRLLSAGIKVMILRIRRMRRLASTGVSALQWSVIAARRQGTEILICGAGPQALAVLESSGISALVGAENIFPGSDVLFRSTRQALARAQMLIRSSAPVQ
ncbi:MAG TPA: SulP family inorganic anion transporter [Levilinea sp.]|nr:SulP family inorganic anion transporter [Levilinea sp.]